MPGFIDRANVKLVSDGSVAGTNLVFIHEDGTEEPIVPVCYAKWELDVRDGIMTPKLVLIVEMAATELVTPANLVEFIGIKNRNELSEIMFEERMARKND